MAVGETWAEAAFPFTVLPLLDDDCAPLDATLESPVNEVQNLRVSVVADSAEIGWDSQDPTAGTATGYDVVAGDVDDLRTSGGYASVSCARNDHSDAPFVDETPVAPGQVRYWLVKAYNVCSAACTYGDSSIVPDPRDALDASTPRP